MELEPNDEKNDESPSNENFTLEKLESDKTQSAINNTSLFGKENSCKRSNKQKKLKCRICKFTTPSEEEYYKHLKEVHHPNEPIFYCPNCFFLTTVKHHLRYHYLARHTDERPFGCELCEYRCINQSMLNSHMRSHQPPCPECKSSKCKCFLKDKSVKRKMEIQPEGHNVSREMMEMSPQLLAFQLQQNMLQFMATQYMAQFNPFVQPHPRNLCTGPLNSTFREPVFETIRESECNTEFKEESEKASSLENEESDSNQELRINELTIDCSKNITSNLNDSKSDIGSPQRLSDYSRSEENVLATECNELIECYQCGILFRNEAMYNMHVQIHSEESYVCEDCGEKIESGSAYNSHVRKNHRNPK